MNSKYEPLFEKVMDCKLVNDMHIANRIQLCDGIIRYAKEGQRWGDNCFKISYADFVDKVINSICDWEQGLGIHSHKTFGLITDGDTWFGAFIYQKSTAEADANLDIISSGLTKEIAALDAGLLVLVRNKS